MADPLVEKLVDHWFRIDAGAEARALAEEQTRLLYARLRSWTGDGPPTLTWRESVEPPRMPLTFGGPFELAAEATMETAKAAGLDGEALMVGDQRLDFIADRVLRLNRAWELAVASGAELPKGKVPPRLRGKRFADLENPFEPLLAVWSLGYLLEADEQKATLYAHVA